jgi:hypothetical protein
VPVLVFQIFEHERMHVHATVRTRYENEWTGRTAG